MTRLAILLAGVMAGLAYWCGRRDGAKLSDVGELLDSGPKPSRQRFIRCEET